jgi:hypothetical protein
VRLALAVGVLAAAVWCVATRVVSGDLIWLMWADRDLMRASAPWTQLPTSGAELSYGMGARVPGGGIYWLMHAGMALRDDPVFIWRTMLALDVAAMATVAWMTQRLLGGAAACLAVAVWALSPVTFDTIRTLWNPGYLPLFVAAGTALSIHAVQTRDARRWPWAMVALAIGAQLHLTAGSLAAVLALGVWVARPAGVLRATLLSALGALVVYAPHLWTEWRDGFPNTVAMRAQSQVGAALDPLGHGAGLRNLSPIAQLLGGMMELPPGDARRHTLGWAAWAASDLLAGFAVAALVVGIATVWSRRERAPVALAAAVVVAGAAYFLTDPAIDMTVSGSGRYLMVLVPAWSLLTAWGVASSGAWLARRSAALGLLPWALAALCVGVQASAWQGRFESDVRGFWRYPSMVQTLDAVTERTGGTLADVTGRTMLWYKEGQGGWTWRVSDGVDDLLRRRGEVFPGSQPPPCAILLLGRGRTVPEPLTADQILDRLAQPMSGLTVLGSDVIGSNRLVRYTHDGERCHTSMTDRYVLSVEEQRLFDAMRVMASGATVHDPDPSTGTSRWVAVIDGARVNRGQAGMPLGLLVDASASAQGVVVALHSNQLRGRAWNSGFFSAAMIADPALLLERDGAEPVRVPIAAGYVGGAGVMTPLHTRAVAVPAGAWRAALVGDVVGGFDEARWPPSNPVTRTPFRVELPDGLVIPAGTTP